MGSKLVFVFGIGEDFLIKELQFLSATQARIYEPIHEMMSHLVPMRQNFGFPFVSTSFMKKRLMCKIYLQAQIRRLGQQRSAQKGLFFRYFPVERNTAAEYHNDCNKNAEDCDKIFLDIDCLLFCFLEVFV